jgi:hypothetical protein
MGMLMVDIRSPIVTMQIPAKFLYEDIDCIDELEIKNVNLCNECLYKKEEILIANPGLTFGVGRCTSSNHDYLFHRDYPFVPHKLELCPVFQYRVEVYEKTRCYHCVTYNFNH